MKLSRVLALAWAGATVAQSDISLADALASQNSSLSSLNGLLLSRPDIVDTLNAARNITVLAPSNDALAVFLNDTERALALAQDPSAIVALLSYHVLNGTYYASSITNTSMFIPTLLMNESYTNITGGQRVQALLNNETVTFYTALKENSTVVTPNVNFTGGTLHIIDTVLSIPANASETLQAANLTAAAGAVKIADLEATLDGTRDLTIFAPNNDAFNNIGNITANITTQQLSSLLQYHVVAGSVEYSNMLENTTFETVAGGNITITNFNGTLFVNSARIVIQDVLVSNGVVHVIDNVLNPMNSTASPDPTATNPPAFPSAGPGSEVPFTTAISAPTSTPPVATSANPGGVTSTSTSTQMAPAVRTGAVGAAALFGGAAVLMNW